MLKWTAVNTYIWPPSSQSADILSSISTIFLTQALWKQYSDYSDIVLIDVQSNHRDIPSMYSNKEAFIDCMLGLGGEGCSLMPPNNTPVYSVLGLPLLNTFLTFQWLHSIQKSAKRDLCCLFSPQLGGRYTMIPWELPGIWRWWWWGGQCLYCLISIGSQCRISPSVLVNNCLLWQNSTLRSINCSDL